MMGSKVDMRTDTEGRFWAELDGVVYYFETLTWRVAGTGVPAGSEAVTLLEGARSWSEAKKFNPFDREGS